MMSFILPAVLTVLLTATPSDGTVILQCDMETFSGNMARGWAANCYGENTVIFSSGTPHSGKTSQKMECKSFECGAAQFCHPIKVKVGKQYTISFWSRSVGGIGSVRTLLRQGSSPYAKYLTGTFSPTNEWKRYTITSNCLVTDDNALLFFTCQPFGPGTMWVDDLLVAESDPIALVLPLPKGNVVPNPSFEVGLDRDWRTRSNADSLTCDDSCAHHGERCLKWDLNGTRATLVSKAIEFGGRDEPFTLSMAVRADGDADVTVSILPGNEFDGKKPLTRLQCKPGKAWSVFRTKKPVPSTRNGAYYIVISVRAKGKAGVWVDSLRFEPGDATSAKLCNRPIEASLGCSPIAHIFRAGKPVAIDARAFNSSGNAKSIKLMCRVTDYWRRLVVSVPIAMDVKSLTCSEKQVQLPIDKTGVFLAELLDGDEVLSELSFCVLPKISDTSAHRSAMGGHFQLDEFHMKTANAMGVKWTRIHDCSRITHWSTTEPKQGQFVWFDDHVAIARKYGINILGEFMRTPHWARLVSKPKKNVRSGALPPRDWNEFANYVRTVVDHYKDDIHYWEVWNEPYGSGFWTGTAEQFAVLAKTVIRAAKEVDPNVRIISPCAYPGAYKFINTVIADGGTQGAYGFSYHSYGCFNPSSYQRVRRWAAERQKKSLPIWNTETGVVSQTFYRNMADKFYDAYTCWLNPQPYDVSAEQSVKLFTMALAGGAEKYFIYWSVYEATLLPRLSAFTIFEYDSSLRPNGVAYAVAGSIMDGMRGEGFLELPGSVLACLLRDDQQMIAVLWRRGVRQEKPFTVSKLPNKIEIRNIMGNPISLKRKTNQVTLPLSGEPLYLIVPIEKADALVESLKTIK